MDEGLTNGRPAGMAGSAPADRRADAAVAAALDAVRARMARATQARGPGPGVELLAVSKTFPAEAVLAAARAGQRAFGENYAQEGADKILRCRDAGATGLQWHFIGPLQSNKTKLVAEHFDWVQSVDREKIARRLSEQRPDGLPPLSVCIQVNASGEATKSGCAPDEVATLAVAVARMPRLSLRGVMSIPAPEDDPAAQRDAFARVRACFEQAREALAASGLDATGLDTLSMGMSADLESAIAEGATMVRVGSAIFGQRARHPG